MNADLKQEIENEFLAHPYFQDGNKALFNKFLSLGEYSEEIDLPIAYKPNDKTVSQDSYEINEISSFGLLLSSPGTYTLTKDIVWNPIDLFPSSAISIVGDGITLDMKGFSISVDPTCQAPNTTGISIIGENNTVMNGTFIGFGKMGLYAVLTTHLTVEKIDIKALNYHLRLENESSVTTPVGIQINGSSHAKLDQCTVEDFKISTPKSYLNSDEGKYPKCPVGIQVNYSSHVTMDHCRVTKFRVTAEVSAGIQLNYVSHGKLHEATVQNLKNYDGNMRGYSYRYCDDIHSHGCKAIALRTQFLSKTGNASHTCIGFFPFMCKGLAYEHCASHDITGCCDDAHGLSLCPVINSKQLMSGMALRS